MPLGITGDVRIDWNGDRIADYSLLDMDPETAEFKVSNLMLLPLVNNLINCVFM